nr:MAG: hypothetical protein DIU66_04995 [Bacillota bacterium]
MFNISTSQRKIFFILLSIVWGLTGFYYMFKQNFFNGVKILICGGIFIFLIAAIQRYAIRMIQLYDCNLKNKKI